MKVKSKRYTYNRIRRMLIHILIGLTKEDKRNYSLNYIKVLGFDKTGKDYLKTVKSDLTIQRKISDTDIAQKYELTASLIYDMLTDSNTYKFETSNKPIIKTSA
ncbi:MAG: nucleotidyltransferase family protein [Clostridium sp.]|nr:MAG: nucleotidyltransferase family protein [Clostridium sp.]